MEVVCIKSVAWKTESSQRRPAGDWICASNKSLNRSRLTRSSLSLSGEQKTQREGRISCIVGGLACVNVKSCKMRRCMLFCPINDTFHSRRGTLVFLAH